MKYTHGRTWNIARNSDKHEKCVIKQKNVEKETKTLFQLDYGEKTEKRGK